MIQESRRRHGLAAAVGVLCAGAATSANAARVFYADFEGLNGPGARPADDAGALVDDIALDITPGAAVVPEPATWAMMLMGFGGLGAVLRRRRAAYA